MEISNSFRVQAPPETTWDALNDIERIAPCLPGAQLQEVDGEEYRGIVKVKLGPVVTQYKGVATFAERDDAAHRAVIRARGRETRGQGNANATITASLHPEGDGTRVDILTDLTITGKAAQFGRGMFSEVSQKLLNQFAQELEAMLTEQGQAGPESGAPAAVAGAPAEGGAAASEPEAQPSAPAPGAVTAEPAPPREVQAIDLTSLAGPAVAKRAAGVVAAAVAALFILGVRRRRRGGRRR